MKKYIASLFLVGLFLIPGLSLAQVADVDPNPSVSNCVTLNNNMRYRDRDATTGGEVSTLQDFLQANKYLNNEPTGYFGLLTVKAVKSFQKKNNISPTGYVGAITRGKIKDISCGRIFPNGNAPVISGISGPQNLKVGEVGTWTVSAYDPNKGTLSYSVDWGDRVTAAPMVGSANNYQVSQSATLTHSYNVAKTYNPKFTVTNASGQSANASLSVKVKSTIENSVITVLSPNGGETLYRGNTQMITWQDTGNLNCLSYGGFGCIPNNYSYDIYLFAQPIPCTATNCLIAAPAPYRIAQNVYGTAYNWQVGNINYPNGGISVGQYKISVCRSDTNVCDSSDNYFTIQ